jgi:hypothetical protein
MASLDSSLNDFTFGVEIKILLRPQNKPTITADLAKLGYEESKSLNLGRPRRENRAAIRNLLAESLSKASLPAMAIHDNEVDQDYEQWGIAWDTTIAEDTA